MASSTPTPPSRLKVIHAGFMRTGTNSMARAYQILGFKPYHALFVSLITNPWDEIDRAADAMWPNLPGARKNPPPTPFTRADWDALWGAHFDVVTDLSSPFTSELIKAYPEVKVVVVERDFDKWWSSYKHVVIDRAFGRDEDPALVGRVLPYLFWLTLGTRSMFTIVKFNLGFFGARTRAECIANARGAYKRYHEQVRRLVPEEKRLEYKMGDGWEPLCEFLGVEVPDVEFPNTNKRENLNYVQVFQENMTEVQKYRLLVSAEG
ncbi:hypothetical protein N0V88_007050 [Collariella sp. IMI 366227]|nr:hypothetical protein N0V88_007050 [Collariella sp. IMI 366227]